MAKLNALAKLDLLPPNALDLDIGITLKKGIFLRKGNIISLSTTTLGSIISEVLIISSASLLT